MFFLSILFWSCAIAMVHTYVLYPLLLKILASGKVLPRHPYFDEKDSPEVVVLMAAYNEATVIAQKIESLQALNYPAHKIKILIGSDNSTDGTNGIIQQFAATDYRIHLHAFTERNGKPRIINRLVAAVQKEQKLTPNLLFLMTDASVMLLPDTLRNLVRHVHDPKIALVDTHFQSQPAGAAGIAVSEGQYVSGEVMLKHRESLLWKRMIGPFGGCYLLRSSYYAPVPPNFLVDDFYIALKVFEQGGGAINDLEARCYETSSDEISEEYRRKARIGAGNFQNLQTFKHLLWSGDLPLAFAFTSHKILRWKGPFFIIFAFFSSAILAFSGNLFYLSLLLIQISVWIILPLIDLILWKFNIHLKPLRNLRYFVFMNLALLNGFFKYLNGIKTNVWQPTKRA